MQRAMDKACAACASAVSASPAGSQSLRDLAGRARLLVREPWRRSYRRFLLRDVTFTFAFALAVVAVAGVSAARCGVVAAVLLWGAALQLFLQWLPVEGERKEQLFAASELSVLASWYLACAATGGLRSPFYVIGLAALPVALLLEGWTWATRAQVAVQLAGTVALGLLPPALLGPAIPARAHGAIVAVFTFSAGWSLLHHFGMLARVATGSLDEAARVREELALHTISRVRELEQVGARLSHELKNPLSAIKTLVQISARTAPEGVARERLQTVEAEVLRMQQILQDHLSFARPLEKLRPREVQLSVVGDEVLTLVAGRAAEARVALQRRGDARVVADPRQLRDALVNLLVNAIDASPPGGTVELEIAKERESARVVVRDSGAGMSEEVLTRIGTPFFTTREDGTGLGVALARAAFAHHGGTLEYASRRGEGTTATATIPLQAARRPDGTRAGGG
jgi:two-component system, NtrC family, sensor histidine kinase HydH